MDAGELLEAFRAEQLLARKPAISTYPPTSGTQKVACGAHGSTHRIPIRSHPADREDMFVARFGMQR